MKHVIVLDDLSEQGLQKLEAAEGISFDIKTGLAGDELRDALRNADGAICRSGVKITPESLDGNERLAAIVRAGVGTDNIDRQAATRQGIIVMNTPTGNTVSTAELAFALMLSLSRNVPQAHASLAAGKWDRKKLSGAQLAGKTLGIVGLGRIGRSVAERAKAFEMKVLAMDPYLSDSHAQKLGVEKVDSLEKLLPEVDYLTVHTPKTPDTDRMIGEKELGMMKPTARLVNCARGGIYDEAALFEALQSGKIGGAAIDVYENEPCTDSPLFALPNVVCTPHLGASTAEAQMQVAVEAVDLLLDYLQNGNIRHSVNALAVAPETLNRLRGFINVAWRLGSLLAQWHGGAIEQCTVEVKGALAAEDTRILQTAVCAGLIQHVVDEDVNIVNANMLCIDRGMHIQTVTDTDARTFQSSINVKVTGGGVERFAGGTLFGNEMIRLVRLDDYRLEAFLDGDLLLFPHTDAPGVIGKVGQILGDARVNIAHMTVGRASNEPGGEAIGVMNLDNPSAGDAGVPTSVVEQVSQIDVCRDVKLIRLPSAKFLPAWLQG